MTNGEPILKVGAKSRRVFQFGDEPDEVKVVVDVVAVQNDWALIDSQFRDEEGKVPFARQPEVAQALWKYVRQLVVESAGPLAGTDHAQHSRIERIVEGIDAGQAMNFLKLVTDEAEALKPFFVPRSQEKPSSQESSDRAIYSD